jgi:hypothetical protein
MQHTLKIETFNTHIHYYLDGTYIGMLVFNKGELSDFRAIIRKSRLTITDENLYSMIKTSLYALLNHYLAERLFLDTQKVAILKEEIVKQNDSTLQKTAEKIKKTNRI